MTRPLAFGAGIAVGSLVSISILSWWNRQPSPKETKTRALPDAIRQEQLSRNELYFGPDGMQRIKKARICVIGLGGVGSHTAHMLARAGVGYLRLIDFDQVTLSSLNRHACATLDDVGIPKVVCLKRFLEKICPDPRHLQIDAVVEMYTADTSEALLRTDEPWDIVIDAIDDIPTKASLLDVCLDQNIRVISCMGAGGKGDVTRLHISDLRTAAKDPLATKLRQSLKKVRENKTDTYLDDMNALAIVYSSEKPVVKLAEFTEEQKEQGVHHFGAVDAMRIRVLPVLGTMPAVMGQSLAAMALCELGNKPFQPTTAERTSRTVRNKRHQLLMNREEKIKKRVLEANAMDASTVGEDGIVVDRTWIGPVQIEQDDVDYLMQLWRHRCAVTNARLGTVLELIRWDEAKPSTCDNLVLVSKHALEKYRNLEDKSLLPQEVRERIEFRLLTASVEPYI